MFSTRQPRLKFGALDRLLAAAERQRLPVTILINKYDLGMDAAAAGALSTYPGIGYPVVALSMVTGQGLADVDALLAGQSSVVTGPSGVGKSSLLSRILGIEIRVEAVSHHNEKGRHTTSAANWYELPGGGAVIDTPGFRDYGLWEIPAHQLADCMPDLRPYAQSCRFSNCRHINQPGCAVRDAVESGAISSRRYRSYVGMLESLP
jgi:ribosome biogenesis GTPase